MADSLDEILGDLIVAIYHYDGKTTTLISPEAIAKIKAKINSLYIRREEVAMIIQDVGGDIPCNELQLVRNKIGEK